VVTHTIDTIALQKRAMILLEHLYGAVLMLLVGMLYFGFTTALHMGALFALSIIAIFLFGLAAHSLTSIRSWGNQPIVEQVSFQRLYIELVLALTTTICAALVSAPLILGALMLIGAWIVLYVVGMRIDESAMPTHIFAEYLAAGLSVFVSFVLQLWTGRWGLTVLFFALCIGGQIYLASKRQVTQRDFAAS
jgi:hypothetical protein